MDVSFSKAVLSEVFPTHGQKESARRGRPVCPTQLDGSQPRVAFAGTLAIGEGVKRPPRLRPPDRLPPSLGRAVLTCSHPLGDPPSRVCVSTRHTCVRIRKQCLVLFRGLISV